MANLKITQLGTASSLAAADLLLITDDPAGTPVSRSLRADAVRTYIKDGFYDQTQAESDASVTPTDYSYPVEADRIDIRRYGWVGDDSTDDLAAYQSAFAVSKQYIGTKETQPDTQAGYSFGGMTVYVPGIGRSYISAGIEIPYNTFLVGDAKRGSAIRSDVDGQIVRTEYRHGPPAVDPYANRSGGISNIRISGSGSGSSQVGLDLLRPGQGWLVDNVEVDNCGSHGVIVRESVGGVLRRVVSAGNGGDGIVLQQGVDNWTDLAANGNPCNAMTLIDCIGQRNDGTGLRINDSNGNIVIGGYFQYNYESSGDNTGFNIEIEGTSRGNTITTWCEGPVQAHVYMNGDDSNQTLVNFLHNPTLIAGGTSGTVDRAVICNKGTLVINGLVGNQSSFKTINGSSAPFQCNKANTGRIFYRGPRHTGLSANGLMIEDENNLDYNLDLYAFQEFHNTSTMVGYGARDQYTESNKAWRWFKDTGSGYDAEAWFAIDAANGLAFSNGTDAADAFLGRAAADVVGCVKAGDGLSVGNDVANTNTPSGATAHAIAIYNESGTLLGYIPVYASQW